LACKTVYNFFRRFFYCSRFAFCNFSSNVLSIFHGFQLKKDKAKSTGKCTHRGSKGNYTNKQKQIISCDRLGAKVFLQK
jgi:hypothetical protein